MALKILIINGPNLNMLGTRQPDIYGSQTLGDIEQACRNHASKLGLEISFKQSNTEGDLITWIQQAPETMAGIIINPAGYGHTSIALMDALLGCYLPKVEVHLSNIYQRDEFRHHSFVSKSVNGVICGLGKQGYLLALEAIASFLSKE